MTALEEIFKAFNIVEDENDKSDTIDEKTVKQKSNKMVADKPEVIVEQTNTEDNEEIIENEENDEVE